MAVLVRELSPKYAGRTARHIRGPAGGTEEFRTLPRIAGSIESPYFQSALSFWQTKTTTTVVIRETDDIEWMTPLDAEERQAFAREKDTETLAARARGDWQEYEDWLARWKLRAAMAKQYSVLLTPEQQDEQEAWANVQRHALAALFNQRA